MKNRGYASPTRVFVDALLFIRSMMITLPCVTFRFSTIRLAAIGPAGSSGCVLPQIRKQPPSTPLSKMYTLQSFTVPSITSL